MTAPETSLPSRPTADAGTPAPQATELAAAGTSTRAATHPAGQGTTPDGFTDPVRIGNAFGPGRPAVICTRCGAVILTPAGDEPDWLDLHATDHRPDTEVPQ